MTSSVSEHAHLLSVNVTHAVLSGEWAGSVGSTGIDKRAVAGRVRVANNAVEGDRILDTEHHGGYDAAVYAYAREDAKWWEGELGIEIAAGRFGENITTLGIDVTNAVIGERWKIGSAVLEVSKPRIPCQTFAGFWDRPKLVKDFMAAGRPGAYLRIIEEGDIGEGDAIEIVARPTHGITISDLYSARRGERSRIAQIAEVAELPAEYREWCIEILAANKPK